MASRLALAGARSRQDEIGRYASSQAQASLSAHSSQLAHEVLANRDDCEVIAGCPHLTGLLSGGRPKLSAVQNCGLPQFAGYAIFHRSR
jgi:hypothetical protein